MAWRPFHRIGKREPLYLDLRGHGNAFGFLRLLFASLVILSHTPELVDGDRARELLTRAFGTLSFGELAVDGFFIISGLLISGSYLTSGSIGRYLLKRVARIYPAFIVSCIVCVTIVASAGGATEGTLAYRVLHATMLSALLHSPYHYGAFAGSHYQDLNGAAWTIAYEFRCYLMVVILGVAGLLRKTSVLAVLTIACLAGTLAFPPDLGIRMNSQWHAHTGLWIGDPIQALRLTGMFLAGATFRSCQQRIALDPMLMAIGGMALILCLCSRTTADFGVATFGAYLIFCTAALGRGTPLERVNNRNDVSYGLYLYAWPIEKLLIAFGFGSSLILLGMLTWTSALAMGALSWFLIERPVMRTIRHA